MENLKHTQLPSDRPDLFVKPKDLLVYCMLRQYEDWNTNDTFVSVATIAKDLNISIPTVQASLKNLEQDGYITIGKLGKKNLYHFNPYKKFEGFSQEFLQNNNLTLEEKAYLTALQKIMRTDDGHTGKISYSNKDIAKMLNISERTVYTLEKSLVSKKFLTIVNNKMRDLETGCITKTKIFNLKDYGQEIVFILKAHHEQIKQNTKDIHKLEETISMLQEQQNQDRKLINTLMNKIHILESSQDAELILN